MAAPEVPIDVDPRTGVWSTDGLPMLYVPRHFFVNNHMAVEKALGVETYAQLLYEAGHRSAWYWCEREAETHGLAGIEVFHHYLKRLSQRGWGRFFVEQVDPRTGQAQVRLEHSAFVYQYGPSTGRRVCYMFAGWFPGSLEWVGHNLNYAYRLHGEEVQCASEAAHNHCRFTVTPVSSR
jgi:predicted hydrocarbon binding protein